jgi:Fe-S-cluster containining protein
MPGPAQPGAPRILRIDIRTRHGHVQGNLAVPSGGMRLAELAWNVMALDDRLVAMAAKAEAEAGRSVTCAKGCGACCRQVVPVSPAEAWMLAEHTASLPPARREAVLARFGGTRARLAEAGFADRSQTGGDRRGLERLSLDYFRLGLPCPFLEDESCSIHPHRPSACREFLAVSPAEYCADPGGLPVRNVPMAASVTDALSRVSAAVLGGEPTTVPLTLALDWAAAHRQEGALRFDALQLMGSFFDILAAAARKADAGGPAAESGGPEGGT